MMRRHIRLADQFAQWLRADGRFDVVAPHPFSLVCFRARPAEHSDPDEWNRKLLAAVNARGPVFLSHTVIEDRYTIRMAIGSAHNTERS